MRKNSGNKAEVRARTPPPGFGSSVKRQSTWEDTPAPRTSRSSGASASRNSNPDVSPWLPLSKPFQRMPSSLGLDRGNGIDTGIGTDRRRRAAAAAISAAAANPGTADAALWRMSRWAENVCGTPRGALTCAVQRHAQLYRALHAAGATIRPSSGPRELGRKVTEAWMDARRGSFLDNLAGFNTKQFCGLMMYLEMAVTLVPDVTAHRLLCIWDLSGGGSADRGLSTPVTMESSYRTMERAPAPSVPMASTAALAPTPSTTASTPPTKSVALIEHETPSGPEQQPAMLWQTQPPEAISTTSPLDLPPANSDVPTIVITAAEPPVETTVMTAATPAAMPAGEPEPDPTSPAPQPIQPAKPWVSPWSTTQAFKFCRKGAEDSFQSKVKLLSENQATSVKGAVEYLTKKRFSELCVMVFTPVNDWYYCVYQRGCRQACLERLGVDEPCGVLSIVIIAGYKLRNVDGWVGKSDPFVQLTVGSETCQTDVITNNLNPVWNTEPFQFQVNIREEDRSVCTLEVFDHSKTGSSESLGKVQFDIPAVPHKQKIRKIDSILDEKGNPQGQLEYEVEFIPKRDLAVASQNAATPTRAWSPGRRRKPAKPTWSFFERELIYQEEIDNFLRNLSEAPSSPLQMQAYRGFAEVAVIGTAPKAGSAVALIPGNPVPPSAATAATFSEPSSGELKGMVMHASTFSGPVSASFVEASSPAAGIDIGTVLRCTSAEGSAVVFENAASALEKSDVKTGAVVTVAGKPVHCDGFWMIPIRPDGAVQLDQFEKVDLTATTAGDESEIVFGRTTSISYPLDLSVVIMQATGLKKGMLSRTPNASCSCEVPGKGYTTVKTRNIKSPDPTWDEHLEISGFLPGDSLEFTIWDKEIVIAQATMTSDQFLVDGYEGLLQLSLEGAALRVSISRSTPESKAKSFQVAQTFAVGDQSQEDDTTSAGGKLKSLTFLSRLLPGRSTKGRQLRAAKGVEVAGS